MDVNSIFEFLSPSLLLAQDGAPDGAVDAAATLEQTGFDWTTYGTNLGIILAIFVLPFIISHFFCKAVRMQTHSTRVGLMLAAIIGAFIFSYKNDFQLKQGIDIKGGTNLVYNIVPDDNGEKIDPAELASALNSRLNPSGTSDLVIRALGESQIELIIPETDEMAISQIQDTLVKAGQLEFRIVANTRDHDEIIQQARLQSEAKPPKEKVLDAEGNEVGRWYRVGREDKMVDGVFPLKTGIRGDIIRNAFTGEILQIPPLNDEDYAVEKWMEQSGIRAIDTLMAFEYAGRPFAVVQGEDLASASVDFNQTTGAPEVGFRLNAQGGMKMMRLTGGINTSDDVFKRRMAIIMDGEVLSAPELNSPISSAGVIQGRFTKAEVDSLVTVLRAGRLPATLESEPASKTVVGAGLGAATIEKGFTASLWAVFATFLCILVYYRFAGIVASVALIINGLLIFGIMIFIKQPLTLPGLAGLVLTVGMSVDANVLIFERIREERAKGSAPRMSIRNGFDRAFTTIIDSNLTTLIAAVVLYWIGTDQVRGFAVALIIGIATSMFTATFCSRIIFEICEKLKLVSLSMSDGVGLLKSAFLGAKDIDFMSGRGFSFIFSMILIVVGIGAVFMRGSGLLNIDFTGGASVTFQLTEPVETDKLREITQGILVAGEGEEPIESTLVEVEQEPANTVYTLVTSIDDPQVLASKLLGGLEENQLGVVTYRVKYTPQDSGSFLFKPQVRYISYQAETQDETTEAAPAGDAPAADAAAEVDASGAVDVDGDAAATGDNPSISAAPLVFTEFELEFSGSDDAEAKISGETLKDSIVAAAEGANIPINKAAIELYPEPLPETWTMKSLSSYTKWHVKLPVGQAEADKIVADFESELTGEPKWLSLNTIGGRVAGEMQQRAIGAILVSLIFIVAYIWFRFQKVAYGLAAVVALVHDVLITVGVLALCHWLSGPLSFLLIEDFKIGLTEVAAFLTIIGYSLNDTIVVFDRIREVRGRSPRLTQEMINQSVNQTLSRTLLTSGTTLLTVLLLYIFGGEGIHTFAFALLIGVLVGTYSSIFVASPVLLWITNRENNAKKAAVA